MRAGSNRSRPTRRPTAVTVAAIVAALIGVGNLVLLLADSDLHHRSRVTGGIVFAALMFIAAIFMWRRAYWAVLGFQTLLALSIVISSLAVLLRARTSRRSSARS